MKKLLLPLLFVCSALASVAETAPVGDMPPIIALKAAPGGSVTFELPENLTTGFEWMAKYDAALCQVTITHRGPENADGVPLCGAPGKAVFTVKLLTNAPADLTLEYRRPWKKNAPPAKTLYYAVIPADNAAQLPPKR